MLRKIDTKCGTNFESWVSANRPSRNRAQVAKRFSLISVMRDLLFSQGVTLDFPSKFPWWLKYHLKLEAETLKKRVMTPTSCPSCSSASDFLRSYDNRISVNVVSKYFVLFPFFPFCKLIMTDPSDNGDVMFLLSLPPKFKRMIIYIRKFIWNIVGPLNQNDLLHWGPIRKVWLLTYASKCFQPKMRNVFLGKVITRFLWAF